MFLTQSSEFHVPRVGQTGQREEFSLKRELLIFRR
jgi:hypothetical protein